jgi:hypothetical protein
MLALILKVERCVPNQPNLHCANEFECIPFVVSLVPYGLGRAEWCQLQPAKSKWPLEHQAVSISPVKAVIDPTQLKAVSVRQQQSSRQCIAVGSLEYHPVLDPVFGLRRSGKFVSDTEDISVLLIGIDQVEKSFAKRF